MGVLVLKSVSKKKPMCLYPWALWTGRVLSYSFGQAAVAWVWIANSWRRGMYISEIVWRILTAGCIFSFKVLRNRLYPKLCNIMVSVRSAMEFSPFVVVQHHRHLPIWPVWAWTWWPIWPIWACLLAEMHISETVGWIFCFQIPVELYILVVVQCHGPW